MLAASRSNADGHLRRVEASTVIVLAVVENLDPIHRPGRTVAASEYS
jgi:hypothetical protein